VRDETNALMRARPCDPAAQGEVLSAPGDRMSRMQHYASYVSFGASAVESGRAISSVKALFRFAHRTRTSGHRRRIAQGAARDAEEGSSIKECHCTN
jgi:hypothetical protein